MQLRIILNCTALFIAFTSTTFAEQNDGESICFQPRIKFLGDLFSDECCSSESNPYAERIETERHDFTQSTKTVGRGVAQVEAGYSYFYKDENNEIENSHATPEMLFRRGLDYRSY